MIRAWDVPIGFDWAVGESRSRGRCLVVRAAGWRANAIFQSPRAADPDDLQRQWYGLTSRAIRCWSIKSMWGGPPGKPIQNAFVDRSMGVCGTLFLNETLFTFLAKGACRAGRVATRLKQCQGTLAHRLAGAGRSTRPNSHHQAATMQDGNHQMLSSTA